MFYKFRKSTSVPSGDIVVYDELSSGSFPELESLNDAYINPNKVIPRLFQYYTENIIRQSQFSETDSHITNQYISEVALYKTLSLMGINVFDCMIYVSDIGTCSFVEMTNNNGWVEILCQIPPQPSLPIINSKIITDIESEVIADDNNDDAIYDDDGNGFSFIFHQSDKHIINFSDIQYDLETKRELSFNCILLFYKDVDDVEKLYGIDFIHPYTLTQQGYDLSRSTFLTNEQNSFGYTFRFNIKSCTNKATQSLVIQEQDGSFYDVFGKALSDFDSFLKLKEQQGTLSL